MKIAMPVYMIGIGMVIGAGCGQVDTTLTIVVGLFVWIGGAIGIGSMEARTKRDDRTDVSVQRLRVLRDSE